MEEVQSALLDEVLIERANLYQASLVENPESYIVTKVWQTSFWMGRFNGPSPKRHRLWSNDLSILEAIHFKAGHMLRSEMQKCNKQLVEIYTDVLGVKRRVGKKKELKDSQHLDLNVDVRSSYKARATEYTPPNLKACPLTLA